MAVLVVFFVVAGADASAVRRVALGGCGDCSDHSGPAHHERSGDDERWRRVDDRDGAFFTITRQRDTEAQTEIDLSVSLCLCGYV